MSLQEYTELNADKRKLWADFCWTLKDTQAGVNSIIEIMKVRESADNLIRDFWATAKKETAEGQNWNELSEEKQERLISY
jgi:hypothetical protein